MDFRLLGRVGAATGAEELQLGPVKRRSVLAALLLKANSAVPVEQLIAALWDDAPPTHARTVVQGHVSRLRALLASAGAGEHGVGLMTQGPSYVFEVPETLLDTCRFERLARRGRLRQRPADAVAVLGEALALWHGPALDGTAPSAPLRAAAQTLEEARLDVVESLAVAHERLGDRAGAVAVLQAEAAAHPLCESLAEALILALYRAGRRSDALDRYHRVRCLLADELGVGPGPGLRGAYETALRGGPAGAGGGGPVSLLPAPGTGPAPVPDARYEADARYEMAGRYEADALLLAPAGRPPHRPGPRRGCCRAGCGGSWAGARSWPRWTGSPGPGTGPSRW